MKTEKELISDIKNNLHELNIEAYGERRHGNKDMSPSLHLFRKYFKSLYEVVYSLYEIEGQEYIPHEYISMINDVEREIEKDLNCLIETKGSRESLADILPNYLIKIQGNLSCILDKI